jgi:hypothetical protein
MNRNHVYTDVVTAGFLDVVNPSLDYSVDCLYQALEAIVVLVGELWECVTCKLHHIEVSVEPPAEVWCSLCWLGMISPIWVRWQRRGVQVIPLLCVDICTGVDWYTAAVTGECIGGAPTRRCPWVTSYVPSVLSLYLYLSWATSNVPECCVVDPRAVPPLSR